MNRKLSILLAVLVFMVCQIFTQSAYAAEVTAGSQADNPFASADQIRQDYQLDMTKDGTGSQTESSYANYINEEKSEDLLSEEQDKAEGRTFLVQFKADASLQDIYDILLGEEYSLIGSSEIRLIELTTDDIDAFTNKAATLIENVEANQTYTADKVPNDAYYYDQWALDAINAPEAWDYTTGTNVGETIYVAVIDSGVDFYHPDLDQADIRLGHDYIYNNYVMGDATGHGTNVTGIIAAETNNGVGIAGVCWNIAIIPLSVTSFSGNIYETDVVSAIYDAADLGCKVINLSMGNTTYSSVMESAIQYANNRGCIVVASSGNSGTTTYSYPASNTHVISVASIDSSNSWSTFSTYNNKVDVCAPGEDIVTTHDSFFDPYSKYVLASGTSFSAPYVSGVAALATCLDSDLTGDQFATLLSTTSRDLGSSGYDTKYGYGSAA